MGLFLFPPTWCYSVFTLTPILTQRKHLNMVQFSFTYLRKKEHQRTKAQHRVKSYSEPGLEFSILVLHRVLGVADQYAKFVFPKFKIPKVKITKIPNTNFPRVRIPNVIRLKILKIEIHYFGLPKNFKNYYKCLKKSNLEVHQYDGWVVRWVVALNYFTLKYLFNEKLVTY